MTCKLGVVCMQVGAVMVNSDAIVTLRVNSWSFLYESVDMCCQMYW